MSEEKLLPCLHCRCMSVGMRIEDPTDMYYVQCDNCLCRTDYYTTEAEARAAWNRRAGAEQEWTAEPPKVEGFYFVFCQKNHDGVFKFVEVYSSGLVIVNGRSGIQLELFIQKNKPLWYKLPTPPLPGKEDAKDE